MNARKRFVRVAALACGVATFALAPLPPSMAHPPARGLHPIDVRIPSAGAGPEGALAVRVHVPAPGAARYEDGAPVLIWVRGGVDATGIDHGFPPAVDDLICLTFLFPGTEDPWSGLRSDGTYDYRGEDCIRALRDVLLYAAGELRDAEGRSIDEIVPVPVLHDNIGMIGESNGGNILAAVAARHGQQLAGRLRYVIQWETPVSSQIATRDFGRIWLKPGSAQGDYWNPRISGYGPLVLPVSYDDLAFDSREPFYRVFHDGTGDGTYSTCPSPEGSGPIPDLNGDGVLTQDEDFPLDTYPVDDQHFTYSRPVMEALSALGLFTAAWPAELVSLVEAAAYWDLRESVRLSSEAIANVPDLSVMILCGVRDHVQALPDKPHIRQAFESWAQAGAWVKINPSPNAFEGLQVAIDPGCLPDLPPNTPPETWDRSAEYAMPASLPKAVYQTAAVYELADRAHMIPMRASSAASRQHGRITWIESEGIGRIAVSINEPKVARYEDGAPVVVNVSGFFTSSTGFKHELSPNAIGAIYITYLWPGTTDPIVRVSSEGTFDYGGPVCLQALRDVIRFATGNLQDEEGRWLEDYVHAPVLDGVTGLYAFSHSGIAATNVLALHGEDLEGVRFFVGRENPTIDALYPLEPGHWDDETGRPVHNPFYDPADYTPASIGIEYATVYWLQNDEIPQGRPAFSVPDGPDYVCSAKHPRMWGKDYWSTALLQSLLDNGSLTADTWPEGLATPEEAAAHWPFRTTVHNYVRLGNVLPTLKVMLVFATDDHVQTAIDKPHIHQAYDGFHGRARLWCRMNPDRAYVEELIGPDSGAIIPDNPANREPSTWMIIRSWGYAGPATAKLNIWLPLAAVAEMCDRTVHEAWRPDVDETLHHYTPEGVP